MEPRLLHKPYVNGGQDYIPHLERYAMALCFYIHSDMYLIFQIIFGQGAAKISEVNVRTLFGAGVRGKGIDFHSKDEVEILKSIVFRTSFFVKRHLWES